MDRRSPNRRNLPRSRSRQRRSLKTRRRALRSRNLRKRKPRRRRARKRRSPRDRTTTTASTPTSSRTCRATRWTRRTSSREVEGPGRDGPPFSPTPPPIWPRTPTRIRSPPTWSAFHQFLLTAAFSSSVVLRLSRASLAGSARSAAL